MTMENTDKDDTDWQKLQSITDAEAQANALADPDNLPVSAEALALSERMPRVKVIRRALGLTQEEFAARYHIPLGTLRDWEQGRSQPDQPARAYLTVIANNPQAAAAALKKGAA
jgi:putative transcriptional regulator